jgi:hypothetical protein
VGGAVLFWLAHERPPSPLPVVVTAGDVERLRVGYTRETGLDPTPADEAALVEKVVEEELFFREAVARGLDRYDRSVRNWLVEQMRVLSEDTGDDADHLYARARDLGLDRTDLVVRRILVQKMRLLAARTDERQPSETELAAFYAAHRDEYRPPDRVTFWNVFLASSVHGDDTAREADATLARLRDPERPLEAATRLGDPFSVPPHVVGQSAVQLAKLFGPAFASALEHGTVGGWIGPVPSPYGLHLVWVEAREPGAPPLLGALRQRLLERWQDEDRTRRLGVLVRQLERRYTLRVESAAWQARRAS